MTNDSVAQRSPRAQESILAEEVRDAMWADFGRTVGHRLHATDDLIAVINRAGMRAKTVREMAAMVQAFLLTGAKP